MAQPRTVAQKIWDAHVVRQEAGQPDLLYIDLHLVHEVTSPQAFDGLRLSSREVRRPDLTLATMDHNVPTDSRAEPYADALSQQQVTTMRDNAEQFSVPLFDTTDVRQGIVHIIGPEQGLDVDAFRDRVRAEAWPKLVGDVGQDVLDAVLAMETE